MTTALYERIAGSSWRQVSEAVRKAHLHGDDLRAKGIFWVRHGPGRIVRLLAWLLRLPAAGAAVPVELNVTPVARGERWDRSFGRKRLVSTQHKVADGVLGERFGPIELRFRLLIRDGALRYDQQGAALCLGRLCLPLPQALAPQTTALEREAGNPEHTYIFVTVSIPIFGLLIAYGGVLEVEERPA